MGTCCISTYHVEYVPLTLFAQALLQCILVTDVWPCAWVGLERSTNPYRMGDNQASPAFVSSPLPP